MSIFKTLKNLGCPRAYQWRFNSSTCLKKVLISEMFSLQPCHSPLQSFVQLGIRNNWAWMFCWSSFRQHWLQAKLHKWSQVTSTLKTACLYFKVGFSHLIFLSSPLLNEYLSSFFRKLLMSFLWHNFKLWFYLNLNWVNKFRRCR